MRKNDYILIMTIEELYLQTLDYPKYMLHEPKGIFDMVKSKKDYRLKFT